MKVFISLATIAALLGLATQPSTAEASPWCHEYQNSVDGSRIQMDNQVVSYYPERFSSLNTFRRNIYLHLSSPSFTGSEHVRFVLLSETILEARPGSGGDRRQETEFIGDAQWDAAAERYTLRAQPNPEYNNDVLIFSTRYRTHQEVAVVVDGKWLKRPDGGGSNFIFDANNYPEFCANPN